MTKLEQVELMLDGDLLNDCPCDPSADMEYGPHAKLTRVIIKNLENNSGNIYSYFIPCENHLKFFLQLPSCFEVVHHD